MKKSFTLLEVVIFIGILGLFFVSIMAASTAFLRVSKFNEHKILAVRYEEELNEWVKGQAEQDWQSFVTNRTSQNPGTPWCFNQTPASGNLADTSTKNGLVSWWNMDSISGNTVNDDSGSGNNGTISAPGDVGDFNDGSLQGWNLDCGGNTSYSLTNSYEGTYALQIGPQTGGSDTLGCIYKSYGAVTTGQTVYYAAKGNSGSIDGLCLWDGSTCRNTKPATSVGTSNGWTIYKSTVNANANVTLYLYASGPIGTYNTFDYVTFGPMIVPGKIGKGLLFNGVNNSMSSSQSNLITNAVTMSFWVKMDLKSGQSNNDSVILAAAQGNNALQIYYSVSTKQFIFRTDYDHCCVQIGSSAYPEGTWHLVTATRDSSGNRKLYIDGALNVSDTTSDWNNVATFLISQPGINFAGTIDDVRIYNRALSADEIQTIYNATNNVLAWPASSGSCSDYSLANIFKREIKLTNQDSTNTRVNAQTTVYWLEGNIQRNVQLNNVITVPE